MPQLTRFTVHGPFRIPYVGTGNRRHVVRSCPDFWVDQETSVLKNRKGCYAFGIRHGSATRLYYVGLAAKQVFSKECFTHHKVDEHYNPVLKKRPNGTPVLYLVAAPPVKPPVNRIDDLESFLIQTAVANHQPLTNKRKRGRRHWTIPGVAYSPQGRPTQPARDLKDALRIGR